MIIEFKHDKQNWETSDNKYEEALESLLTYVQDATGMPLDILLLSKEVKVLKELIEKAEKLEKALDLACYELEQADYVKRDYYLHCCEVYYDTKDRKEWKEYLLGEVEE